MAVSRSGFNKGNLGSVLAAFYETLFNFRKAKY